MKKQYSMEFTVDVGKTITHIFSMEPRKMRRLTARARKGRSLFLSTQDEAYVIFCDKMLEIHAQELGEKSLQTR